MRRGEGGKGERAHARQAVRLGIGIQRIGVRRLVASGDGRAHHKGDDGDEEQCSRHSSRR